MKSLFKNSLISRQGKVFTALILTGFLSIGNGLTPTGSATATPNNPTSKATNQLAKQNNKANGLPRLVADAVLQDVARRQKIPVQKLQIEDFSEQTWRNGCLGLPKRGELCTQALVKGWQIVVSNGQSNWTYRTNNNGRHLRLQNVISKDDGVYVNIPSQLRNAVLRDASRRLNQPISELRLNRVQRRTWSNGCLELPRPNEFCSQVLVKGWRIVVGSFDNNLVYHSNESGSAIRLNERESQSGGNNNTFSDRVAELILERATDITGIPRNQLRIVEVERITVDGCLNLPRRDEACTKIAQPAWKVTVASGKQRLVFHSTLNGSEIRYNDRESNRTLPASVRDAVFREASQLTGLNFNEFEIVKAEARTWSDGCLEIYLDRRACPQVVTPGWLVIIQAKREKLVYHTNESGSIVRFNRSASDVEENNLPRRVSNAVLEAASDLTRLPSSEIRITRAEQIITDGCLNLPRRGEACPEIALQAWRVTVTARDQRLVFHANPNGYDVRLNPENSEYGNNLPDNVRNAVQRRAREVSGLPSRALSIISSKRTRWNYGCENNSRTCDPVPVSGWEVIVGADDQRWVFLTNEDGSLIRLARSYYETNNANLPDNLAQKVLAQAAADSGIRTERLRISDVVRRDYPDSCLGIREPGRMCAQVIVTGWEVTVTDGKQRWVYRVGQSGEIRLDEEASQISDNTLEPVKIPRSELPPPLGEEVVFRQISSGGFAGRTYQTVLLEDGRVIRFREGGNNEPPQTIRKISRTELREFRRLLEERDFAQYRNLRYPAPRNSADYITYTLTGEDGTMEYNDISQNRLPKNLRAIVNAWNKLISDN